MLDTWFSSALWPFSTLGWPNMDSEDLEYFYLFRNQYGGYMLPKSELGERTKAFREFIEEKTGQKFRDREVPIVKIMRKLKLIH